MEEHWNAVYQSSDTTQLGWYEETPAESLRLIDSCELEAGDLILDVGSGASTLIDTLLARGFRNIVAADISEAALTAAGERLGPVRSKLVTWIVDDLTAPVHLEELQDVRLWHDRAVLHFLLEEKERVAYRDTLKRVVGPGGYVIIAAFSLVGAPKCSGLQVRRYDTDMLSEFLGTDFRLLESFDTIYHMPSGAPRPYVYTLFKRV